MSCASVRCPHNPACRQLVLHQCCRPDGGRQLWRLQGPPFKQQPPPLRPQADGLGLASAAGIAVSRTEQVMTGGQ